VNIPAGFCTGERYQPLVSKFDAARSISHHSARQNFNVRSYDAFRGPIMPDAALLTDAQRREQA